MGLKDLRFPFLKSKPHGDGIHILSRTDGGTTLELRKGARVELLQVPSTVALVVERSLDGTRSRLALHARGTSAESSQSWELEMGSEQACAAQYDQLVRGLRLRRNPWKSPWTVFAALLVTLIVATPTYSNSEAQLSLGAAQTLNSSAPVAADKPSSLLTANEFTEVAASQGIALRKNGTVFYVFSDPNCPFCKELESNLANVDSALNPTIVPVGFKPGSREAAAAALCSQDPAKAWHNLLVSNVAPPSAPCEKGLRQVDENNALFERLQFTSTPTLVSPKGQIVVGSGSSDQIQGAMIQ
jgi:protein-disulfide isomerase